VPTNIVLLQTAPYNKTPMNLQKLKLLL